MSKDVKIEFEDGAQAIVTEKELKEFDKTGTKYEIIKENLEAKDYEVSGNAIPVDPEQPNDESEIQFKLDENESLGSVEERKTSELENELLNKIVERDEELKSFKDEIDRVGKLNHQLNSEMIELNKTFEDNSVALMEALKEVELLKGEIEDNRAVIAQADRASGKDEDLKIANQDLLEMVKVLKEKNDELAKKLEETTGVDVNSKNFDQFMRTPSNKAEFLDILKSIGKPLEQISSDEKKAMHKSILKKRGK